MAKPTKKRPMVALLLAPNLGAWFAVVRGDKRITIREGHRDYRKGDRLILCCHLAGVAVGATVAEVTHTTLNGVTDEELLADGFVSRGDMLEGLRQYYPDLTFDSPVTVIRWGKLEGRWARPDQQYDCLNLIDSASTE